MKLFTSKTQQTGERGEQEAANFLINKGFKIIERNYTKKWGELDMVAQKGNVLHFIEVKSITVRDGFSRENTYRPEDNMHTWKIKRLRRALESYIMDREVDENQEWQFDLICVYFSGKGTRIELIEDIILS